MATKVITKYELVECRNIIIKSADDVKKVLSNDIIPTYREHLKQINICIIMFEELEDGRSLGDVFSDLIEGTRRKVIKKELIPRLRSLKQEILIGISLYMKLLAKKNDLREYLEYLPISKFKLDTKHEKVQEDTRSVSKIGSKKLLLKGDGVENGKWFDTVIQAGKMCSSVVDTVDPTHIASLAVGAAVIIIGDVIRLIYTIAKDQGKKRVLKYQQIIYLKAALDDEYFATIRTNHEILKNMYDTIDKH